MAEAVYFLALLPHREQDLGVIPTWPFASVGFLP